MANVVETLVAGIEAQVVLSIDPEFNSLTHVLDVSKNTFKGNMKRYGVLPRFVSETEGVTRHYTVNQEFEIILTDGYVSNSNGDAATRSKTLELYDMADAIYKRLVNSKCGVPSTVMLVTDLTIPEPEYDESNKTITLRIGVTVRYRQPL